MSMVEEDAVVANARPVLVTDELHAASDAMIDAAAAAPIR